MNESVQTEIKDYTIKLTERELCDILMALDSHINHCNGYKERSQISSKYYLNWIDRLRPLFARLSGND